ncbi:SSH4 family protein [Aspergillus clavatus NRRL 1]|uniref:SPRY domain-containing protein n=1 Tax=Aspergillus clavatus (strain ATCC 1007 / CBS 513.65 / DSM 816 / NCTC 3887 / NRRL 1 / QM 1276 / 107) TaxID=344612 RepID=A1CFZ1_ASPCL|nr:uncharacterized protein ACLA_065030 [Aspergillus clavatus NRRL 1]EAW10871.1 conserved hypothetical protein [Aspergillus clavatus NRRL 1]
MPDRSDFRGPPPSYQASQSSWHSGQAETAPPPYHNWQELVPDTATLPPPPVTGYYASNAGNASTDDAERAHDFCDRVPLYLPEKPPTAAYSCVQRHDLRPVQPQEFYGNLGTTRPGYWNGSTRDRNGDCIIITSLPLYFAFEDSPYVTEVRKAVYFEVKLLGLRAGPGTGSADASGFSIGFVAQPYPTWRSPGWERGSLGVFSDDGCRFVNDSWGGKEFTTGFHVGETVGLGLNISLPDSMNTALGMRKRVCRVEVFFTRNGQRAGAWDLHEEVDQEAGGVEGLEGDYDLYGAIGLFGGVNFEACFDPAGWLWKP